MENPLGDITTDNVACRLYIKYRADKQNTKTKNYSSWNFSFTDSEINELKNYIQEYNLSMALVCGVKVLSESEIAVLDKKQIEELLNLNKSSVSISRKKNERAYRIPVGGGRDNAIKVKANRFVDLFLKGKKCLG